MERTHRIILACAMLALPAAGTAAHSLLAKPEPLCFASGSMTYRVSTAATAPDYRVRIDNAAATPDLRIGLVDRPEIADFVLADDFDPRERNVCGSGSGPIRTVKIDAETPAPDITIAMGSGIAEPDVTIYVRSMRFSHQDAAALQAVMWKAEQRRRLAQRQ